MKGQGFFIVILAGVLLLSVIALFLPTLIDNINDGQISLGGNDNVMLFSLILTPLIIVSAALLFILGGLRAT